MCLSEKTRSGIRQEMKQHALARLTSVLGMLGIASSSWYQWHKPECDRARPGPDPRPVPPEIEQAVLAMATDNPWYGYKRIAVMCRRAKHAVTNRQCCKVMKQHGLLLLLLQQQKKKKKARAAEVYQTAKRFVEFTRADYCQVRIR